MIALAISDSPVARELLAAGALDVDYLETRAHLAETARDAACGRPLLLHNALYDWSLAGADALERSSSLAVSRARMALTGAPWLSAHLGFSAELVAFDGAMRARSATLPREALLPQIAASARGLAAGIDAPLLLENLDYNPGGAYEHICEPSFIAAAIAESGAGLLLDLAHAQVSADALGLSAEDYLAQLPLERAAQIHISGPRLGAGGRLADAHETLAERDLALLRHALARCAPAALTLEYSREAPALVAQLAQLRALLREVRP